jgi:hypothetical protein
VSREWSLKQACRGCEERDAALERARARAAYDQQTRQMMWLLVVCLLSLLAAVLALQ